MRGSGGTEGGVGQYVVGFCLAIGAGWLFLDSVKVATAGYGIVTGCLRQGFGPGEVWDTTSMGIIFVPFLLGVIGDFLQCQVEMGLGVDVAGDRHPCRGDSQPHPLFALHEDDPLAPDVGDVRRRGRLDAQIVCGSEERGRRKRSRRRKSLQLT